MDKTYFVANNRPDPTHSASVVCDYRSPPGCQPVVTMRDTEFVTKRPQRQLTFDSQDGVLNLSTKAQHSPTQREVEQLLHRKPVQMVYPAVHLTSPRDTQSDLDVHQQKKMNLSSEDSMYVEMPQSRKQRDFVPNELKDSSYWIKRIKNNMAAKRSREKRRMADVILEHRVSKLARENEDLKSELDNLKEMMMEWRSTKTNNPKRITSDQPEHGGIREERAPPPPANRAPHVFNSPPAYHTPSMFPQVAAAPPYRPPVSTGPVTPLIHPEHAPLEYFRNAAVAASASRIPGVMWPFASTSGSSVPSPVEPGNSNVRIPPLHTHLPPQLAFVPPPSKKGIGRRPLDTPPTDLSDSEEQSSPDESELVNRNREKSCVDDSHAPEHFVDRVDSPIVANSTNFKSPSKDSEHCPPSLSPHSSDSHSRLSPTEINRLPHKIRAKMLRSLTPPEIYPCDEPAAVESPKSEQCSAKKCPTYDESVVMNIKEEPIDIDTPPPSEGSGVACSVDPVPGPSASEFHHQSFVPKQEPGACFMPTIEDELNAAKNLVPFPTRPMSEEETDAYLKLVEAAKALADAKIKPTDVISPTPRQLTRQRTRVMSPGEKYRDKRIRNNLAAKKCRDAKRLLTNYRAARSNFFEIENVQLRNEMKLLINDVTRLRELIRQRNKKPVNISL